MNSETLNPIIESGRGFGFTPIGEIKVKRLSWWVDQWIPKAGIVFVSAYAKAGKSTLVHYASLKLTRGESLFGKFKTRCCKVLYFALEDHKGEVKEKAKKMLRGMRFPKGFLISSADSISLPEDVGRIECDLVKSEADIVVIDTLRRAHSGEENSSTDMSTVLNGLRALAQRYKKTIIIVHHAGNEVLKASPADKDNAKTWLRGSSDMPASYDVLIALERKEDDAVNVRVFHKYRSNLSLMSYVLQKSNEVDLVTGDHFITDLVLTDNQSSAQDLKDEALIEAVLLQRPDRGDSANNLTHSLKGRVSRPRIDSALKRMAPKGIVTREGKGRAARWRLNRSSTEMDARNPSSTHTTGMNMDVTGPLNTESSKTTNQRL